MATRFIIKKITSWAVIELQWREQLFEANASYVRHSTFNDLLDAMVILLSADDVSATVTLERETDGEMLLVFNQFVYQQFAPGVRNSYIKLTVYDQVDWDEYADKSDYDEEPPLPVPVFESLIVDKVLFAREVLEEYERHGRDAFEDFDNKHWDEKTEALRKAIKKARKW